MGYEFLLTAWGHTQALCRGGMFDLCIRRQGFGLNQIMTTTPGRKIMHNNFSPAYFPHLEYSLKYTMRVRYQFHFGNVYIFHLKQSTYYVGGLALQLYQ